MVFVRVKKTAISLNKYTKYLRFRRQKTGFDVKRRKTRKSLEKKVFYACMTRIQSIHRMLMPERPET